MNRFLFLFGYESPVEHATNAKEGTDFESSNAIWVRANSEDEALVKGRRFAADYVDRQYLEAGVTDYKGWLAGNFAHWICPNPLEQFSRAALENIEEI